MSYIDLREILVVRRVLEDQWVQQDPGVLVLRGLHRDQGALADQLYPLFRQHRVGR